jgi:hypothetical protein
MSKAGLEGVHDFLRNPNLRFEDVAAHFDNLALSAERAGQAAAEDLPFSKLDAAAENLSDFDRYLEAQGLPQGQRLALRDELSRKISQQRYALWKAQSDFDRLVEMLHGIPDAPDETWKALSEIEQSMRRAGNAASDSYRSNFTALEGYVQAIRDAQRTGDLTVLRQMNGMEDVGNIAEAWDMYRYNIPRLAVGYRSTGCVRCVPITHTERAGFAAYKRHQRRVGDCWTGTS